MEIQDSASNLTITITADSSDPTRPTAEDVEITGETKITWELDDSVKSQWDLVAIQWKPGEVDGSGDFVEWVGPGSNGGKKIKTKDKCTIEGDFGYWIWVTPSEGTGEPLKSADPTIRNRPS